MAYLYRYLSFFLLLGVGAGFEEKIFLIFLLAGVT